MTSGIAMSPADFVSYTHAPNYTDCLFIADTCFFLHYLFNTATLFSSIYPEIAIAYRRGCIKWSWTIERINVADPDAFGPDLDPTFEKNRIRIRPLKKIRIRILFYVKFCTNFLYQEIFACL
jgi:hypothetical protein